MKTFFALIQKEFGDLMVVIFFVYAITFLAQIFDPPIIPHQLSALLPLGFGFLVPILLVQSYSIEWKSMTSYTLLSLPIPRFYIPLSKFLLHFLFGVGILVIVFVCIEFWQPLKAAELGKEGHFLGRISPKFNIDEGIRSKFWVTLGAGYLLFVLFSLSVITFSESVRASIRRFRRITPWGLVVAVSVVFSKCAEYFVVTSLSEYPEQAIKEFAEYAGCFSLVLLIVAFFIFHNFAEAE